VLLVTAVLATQSRPARPQNPRRLSIVL